MKYGLLLILLNRSQNRNTIFNNSILIFIKKLISSIEEKLKKIYKIVTKYILLYKKLKEFQIIISNYKLAFKKFENSITFKKVQLKDIAKDLKKKILELQITIKRIQKLEKKINKAIIYKYLIKEIISKLEEKKIYLNLAL